MAKDFYAILGVSKSASETEIKQAYRKLSRELHPDKHKGDKDKEAKFKEVNEAYEVLSDPKKKENYDRFGSADFGAGGGGFGGFSGFSGQGFDPSQFSGDLGDLFENFFGGAAGRRQQNDGRGRRVEVEISVTFAESVSGAEKTIEFKTNVSCSHCSGNGAEPGSKLKTCNECNGTGAVERTTRSLFGAIRQSVICPTCKGSGKVPEKACKKCGGDGRVNEKKKVKVRIPAGIDDGQSLRLTGEGEAGRQGGASGDLIVRVHVEPDERFVRDGDDIRTMLPLPLVDAVLGTEIEIDTVHGASTIGIPAGTQPNQVLRLKGKGMPVVNTSRHGDHYVTVDIVIPTKLSKEERTLYEELKKSQK
jgi:molecular chaperone DnaJ